MVLDEFQSSSTVQEWPNCPVGFPVELDGVGGTDADPAVNSLPRCLCIEATVVGPSGDLIDWQTLPCPILTCGIGQGVPSS